MTVGRSHRSLSGAGRSTLQVAVLFGLIVLLAGCDSWPFESGPELEWESGRIDQLEYPIGHFRVDVRSNSIELDGQARITQGVYPVRANLERSGVSLTIRVDPDDCQCFWGHGIPEWWDLNARISGLDEGHHDVRLILNHGGVPDTLFADRISIP